MGAFWRLPHDVRRSALNALRPAQSARYETARKLPVRNDSTSLVPMLRLNALFVHVPKTAGTSVTNSLYGNKGMSHWRLRDYALALNSTEFLGAYRFSFVRNPYTRTVSVYNYLSKGGNNDHDDRVRRRSDVDMDSLNSFVASITPQLMRAVAHLAPQTYFLSLPGSQRALSAIGFYETLESDFAEITATIGHPTVCLPALNRSPTGSLGASVTDLTDDSIERIRWLYRRDFASLGYSLNPDVSIANRVAQTVADTVIGIRHLG